MRALSYVLCLLTMSGVTYADKTGADHPGSRMPVPCGLASVAYDWDFALGDWSFEKVTCESGGVEVWEYGTTTYIPDSPGDVWGTILYEDYLTRSGEGLRSPEFVVTEQCDFLELVHYFETEINHDGCNVHVIEDSMDTIIHPLGGYPCDEISSDPDYHAYCVEEEPGWTGSSETWRIDCFDLSAFMGELIEIQFDFGSDSYENGKGWYIARVSVGSRMPPNDDCAGAVSNGLSLDRCTSGSRAGNSSEATDDYNASESFPSCTGRDSYGNDVVFYMDLQVGDIISMVYNSYACDASFYIVTNCGDMSTCVIGKDENELGEPEQILDFSIPWSGRYYLILDSFEQACGGPWELEYEIRCPPPPRACCDLVTGACALLPPVECAGIGGEWHPDWVVCDPNPCPPEVVLTVGPWFDAEPWHRWFGPAGERIPLELHWQQADELPLTLVEFFYSTNGGTSWEFIGDDSDGSEPHLDTHGSSAPEGDGWSVVFEVPQGLPAGEIVFRATAHFPSRGTIDMPIPAAFDPVPPSGAKTGLEETTIVSNDTLGLSFDPGPVAVSRLLAFRRIVAEGFAKPVPGIHQQLHSPTSCGPASAAQCFKYFEAEGDTEISGGLNDSLLVRALAGYMRTNIDTVGTSVSNWVRGTRGWVRRYGSDYTVRDWKFYTDEGGWTWRKYDWIRMRDELHQCHDVLLGIFWNALGGHAVTLNAIVNAPLENGRYLIGFKDPWTALTETAEIDTSTGYLCNVSGAGGGADARIGAAMVIAPEEANVAEGGVGDLIYDGPLRDGPPYVIEIPLPDPGYYLIQIIVENTSGHAHTFTGIVKRVPLTDVEVAGARPLVFGFVECSPNPFREIVELTYAVPVESRIDVEVYDVTGRKVSSLVRGNVGPGYHQVRWDGRDDRGRILAAGIYYAKMKAPSYEETRKITFLR